MIDALFEQLYDLQESIETVALQILSALTSSIQQLPNMELLFGETYAKPVVYVHKDDDKYNVTLCFICGARVVDETLFILYNESEDTNGLTQQINVNDLSLENAVICFEAIKNHLNK